ncbi:MAG TPA: globin-coupled sensor protein [Cerasibacillus sp.]|uniref:globin-coupled sensor protein n=1 Tax=Cerasibacillus sp. TaxID=2498711 RepID=UPI002F3FE9A3
MFSLLKVKHKNNLQEASLLELSQREIPHVQVPVDLELAMQLQMVSLTREDFAIAKALKPYVEKEIQGVIDNFYDNLEHNPSLINIINEHSSIERLKKTLRRHIVEMFSGTMNEQFLHKRKQIAIIHLNIGLTQKWYIASFEKIFDGLVDTMTKYFSNIEDQLIAIKVIQKLLNLEQQVVLEAYDEEIERIKNEETEQKAVILDYLETTSNEFAMMIEETSHSIQKISQQLQIITNDSKKGTELADSAKHDALEGNNRLSEMRRALDTMETNTVKATDDMKGLDATSQQIKDIIEMVKSIADQTNLLALNASIEAARAGQHGRGFAVVADEIRKLSVQTASSVTKITNLISQTNKQIDKSTASMADVARYLEDVRHQMTNTEHAFHQINQSMDETTVSNENIEYQLETVSTLIRDISQANEVIPQSLNRIKQLISDIQNQ